MVCSDSQPPTPLTIKGNSKFEILLAKIFSLKQKKHTNTNYIFPATKEKKSTFCYFKKKPHVLSAGLEKSQILQIAVLDYVLYSSSLAWNLVIVTKNNLKWSHLLVSSSSLLIKISCNSVVVAVYLAHKFL